MARVENLTLVSEGGDSYPVSAYLVRDAYQQSYYATLMAKNLI